MKSYPYSCFCYIKRPKMRPGFLQMRTSLQQAGGLSDPGWKADAQYLVWQAAHGPAVRTRAYVCLSRGWALGSREFREALVKDHALMATGRAWEVSGAEEIHRSEWREALTRALTALDKTETEIWSDRKSALSKVGIAAYLKQTTQVSNGWLADSLQMGSATAVSQYVGLPKRHRSRRQAAPYTD